MKDSVTKQKIEKTVARAMEYIERYRKDFEALADK